jgi:hypothetical protein
MGQQLNKIVKRRRRKLYLARKEALAKAGVSRNARTAKSEAKPAKKAAAKKPAAKKAAAPKVKAVEVAAEAAAPVAAPEAVAQE